MRAIVQRVKECRVDVKGRTVGTIKGSGKRRSKKKNGLHKVY